MPENVGWAQSKIQVYVYEMLTGMMTRHDLIFLILEPKKAPNCSESTTNTLNRLSASARTRHGFGKELPSLPQPQYSSAARLALARYHSFVYGVSTADLVLKQTC